MNFICTPCKEAADHPYELMMATTEMVAAKARSHDKCVGGTYCDCQHRRKK